MEQKIAVPKSVVFAGVEAYAKCDKEWTVDTEIVTDVFIATMGEFLKSLDASLQEEILRKLSDQALLADHHG